MQHWRQAHQDSWTQAEPRASSTEASLGRSHNAKSEAWTHRVVRRRQRRLLQRGPQRHFALRAHVLPRGVLQPHMQTGTRHG